MRPSFSASRREPLWAFLPLPETRWCFLKRRESSSRDRSEIRSLWPAGQPREDCRDESRLPGGWQALNGDRPAMRREPGWLFRAFCERKIPLPPRWIASWPEIPREHRRSLPGAWTNHGKNRNAHFFTDAAQQLSARRQPANGQFRDSSMRSAPPRSAATVRSTVSTLISSRYLRVIRYNPRTGLKCVSGACA